jgi:hypothetical protein
MIWKALKWIVIAISMLFTMLIIACYTVIPYISYEFYSGKNIAKTLSPKWLLSDQPEVLSLNKNDLNILYASQAKLFTKLLFSNIIHFPQLVFNYSFGHKNQDKIDDKFFGMSIDPNKNDINETMEALSQIGVKSVLIRINYGKDLFSSPRYAKILESVQKLKSNGYEVLIVLAQNRDIFSDNAVESFTKQVMTDLKGKVSEYQVGEAINRPKWGVLFDGEYEQLFFAAKKYRDLLDPKAKLIAPSIIDFEWLYSVYLTNAIDKSYDVLNSLLYVDRVRQPENGQMNFDTLDKIKLMSAVDLSKPFYITEFNWPIENTGEYKPTSNKEAVSEKFQAAYNTRYLLLAMGSGKVSKVYYWQLYAKGYGLIDHLDGRKLESFDAFKTVVNVFKESKIIALNKLNDNCYRLTAKKEKKIEAMWCKDESELSLARDEKKEYLDINGHKTNTNKINFSPIYVLSD